MSDKNRIAVLGGAGFLGTRLSCRLDSAGHEYISCDIDVSDESSEVQFVDVEDLDSLSTLATVSTLVNLAAVHRDDVRPISKYDDVNVQGAVNVCEAARTFGIEKIIFTSSVAIYGFAPPNTDETGEPTFFNDYGRTKYLAEQVYKEWHAEDSSKRTLIIVRPTVIFGEGNRGNVYNLLKQVASRKFVMFGNGKNKKSMAYVENVAAFIEHSLTFSPGLHIYNYIDKPDFDMNTLISKARKFLFGKQGVGLRLPSQIGIAIGYCADFIARVTGRSLPVSSIRVKKFMGTTQFSSAVAKSGFKPPVPLEVGLKNTIQYEFIEENTSKREFYTE